MQETKAELLSHLDRITREMTPANTAAFTTTAIAEDCHVSRNLASQYLNELVRDGLAVKVNGRPVRFMHRRGVERFLQAKVDACEFDSMAGLLALAGETEYRDFDRAIGCELSLATCVEQLKSAIQYPPCGIPAFLVGEHGTGKCLLSRSTFEYGVNEGILPPGARYVYVDCSRYKDDEAAIERDVFGEGGRGGAVEEAAGGVIYLSRIDHLSRSGMVLLLQRILEGDLAGDQAHASARFLISTSRDSETPVVRTIARTIPITVLLPRLQDRALEERTTLVMHYLRAEGRRVAADVSISRGALRALVEAKFDDNLDGLRSCIVNCCATAYLDRADERLIIRAYNLPSTVLGSMSAQVDDDQLVSVDRHMSEDPMARVVSIFQRMVDPYQSYCEGAITNVELSRNVRQAMLTYADYMNFETRSVSPRISSYEQVLGSVIEEVNRLYGIELSRKVSRSLAQSLHTQLRGGVLISRWRAKNSGVIRGLVTALRKGSQTASIVVDQIAAKTKVALGLALDDLTTLLLLAEVGEVLESRSTARDYLGVILCHGYSTATSIADAANRILHARVFEAVDMTYDQEVTDVVDQLSRLLEVFSHAKTVAILVDMGSLEKINEAMAGLATADLFVANNVSTSLALEVGSALLTHDSVEEALERCVTTCVPHFQVMRCSGAEGAVVFCSESGPDAADKIRRLVGDSVPGAPDVTLLTCDYAELAQMGEASSVFSDYHVRAIVGTMDPGIASVPFVGLEDILYAGSSAALDKALVHSLGPEGVAEFHANLLRNLTLRNVIESITILNPEMLYVEADRAVKLLAKRTGEEIDSRRTIGLYVHLCGLIERLVTKNFVETYPGVEGFVADNPDFVRAFREAFADMCRRYRVEIPASEIAYVHHMLNVDLSARGERATIRGLVLEDE